MPNKFPALMPDRHSEAVRAKREKLLKDKADRTSELLRLKEFRCRRNAEVKRNMRGLNSLMSRPQLLCNSPLSILRGKWLQHLSTTLFMKRSIDALVTLRCRQICNVGMLQSRFVKICGMDSTPSLLPTTVPSILYVLRRADIRSLVPESVNSISLAYMHFLNIILTNMSRISRLWTAPIAVALGIVRFRKLRHRREIGSELIRKFLNATKLVTALPNCMVTGLHAIARLQRFCKRFISDKRLLRDSVFLRWGLMEMGIIKDNVLQSHRELFNREFSRINGKSNPRYEMTRLKKEEVTFNRLIFDHSSESKIYSESLIRIYKVDDRVREIAVDVIIAARRKVLASIFIDQASATRNYERKVQHHMLLRETFELMGIPLDEKPPKRVARSFVNRMIPTRIIKEVMRIVYSSRIREQPLRMVAEALRLEVAHLPKSLWGHAIRL